MKKLIVVLALVFVSSCIADPYQSRLSYLNEELATTKARDYEAWQAWERLKTYEADFISRLNDEQLAAYQNLSDIYGRGNPAAEELARRRLEQCLDANSYTKAIQVMQDKHLTRLEIDAVGRSYENLRQQGKELERMQQQERQAISDYMLRESIRNSGRSSYGR
jgi:hypothetical protein